MENESSPTLNKIDKHNISQLLHIRIDELSLNEAGPKGHGALMYNTLSERKLTQAQLKAMHTRIAKLKKATEKAEQAVAASLQREQQLMENRLKLKAEQDFKERWKLELKQREEELRHKIKRENDEKLRKLNEARLRIHNGRKVNSIKSQAQDCKASMQRAKQEYSYYAKADFRERKQVQITIANDFMTLVQSRDQRSNSLKERLKADYQQKMQRERLQTEEMSSRIRHLEQVEAQMFAKLKASQDRALEKGRNSVMSLNRSVRDTHVKSPLRLADRSF